MTRGDLNPYQPPEAELVPERKPGRFRPWLMVIRLVVGLWGLFILAGPSRGEPLLVPPNRMGDLAAKGIGSFLFLVAVFPFGKPLEKTVGPKAVEAEDL